MPDALARFHVDADDGLREEVVAGPVPAVHVVGGRRGRHVDVAELLVGGEERPDRRVAAELPGAVTPGLRAVLARLRNGVEDPLELAGADIEGAHVAADVLLGVEGVAHRLAHHDRVADDGRRAAPAVARALGQTGLQVDPPVVAEIAERLAGGGIERVQPFAAVGDDAPLGPVGPEGDAAVPRPAEAGRRLLERLLHPDGLAGRRIPGLDQADRVRRVDDAVDHQRRRAVRVAVAEVRDDVEDRLVDRRAGPGDLQLVHVAGIDLIERRVLRCAEVGGVSTPLPVDRPVLGERGRGGAGQDDNERTSQGAGGNVAFAHHRFLQSQSGQMRIIGRRRAPSAQGRSAAPQTRSNRRRPRPGGQSSAQPARSPRLNSLPLRSTAPTPGPQPGRGHPECA